MSDPGPAEPFDDGENPFAGMGFLFADLAKLLNQKPGANWDSARQFAVAVATEGATEPNVDPGDRIALEDLARVADLQVAATTGLSTTVTGSGVRLTAVTRATAARDTLEAWRPYLDDLAGSLRPENPAEIPISPEMGDDPLSFLGPLLEAMGPMMLSMVSGVMVGHLTKRSLGPYTLPIPRRTDDLGIVLANVDEFSRQWSLPTEDLRLWICVREIAHHATLGVSGVRTRIESLLHDYLRSFEPDPSALERRLADLAPAGGGMDDLQQLFEDPEVLLGSIQTPRQREILPQLGALVAVVVGFVDHVTHQVGTRLLSGYGALEEALHRERVEATAADRFIERLFGLDLSSATRERGRAFVSGVLERAGEEGLSRLWGGERELPTPAEVDAPGLWLARIDLAD